VLKIALGPQPWALDLSWSVEPGAAPSLAEADGREAGGGRLAH